MSVQIRSAILTAGTEPVTSDLQQLRPVNISVTYENLPSDIADQVRQVQEQDPELLKHFLMYCMTRKLVFETLQSELRS